MTICTSRNARHKLDLSTSQSVRATWLILACLAFSFCLVGALPAQTDSLIPRNILPPSNPEPETSTPRSTESNSPSLTTRQIYDQTVLGTVWIMNGTEEEGWQTTGTGFVVDRELRLIMTNQHVIASGSLVDVFFPEFVNGQIVTQASYYLENVTPVRGQIIDSDIEADLALVQVASIPDFAVELEMATNSAQPADRIHAIGGNPQGSDTAFVYCNGSVRGVATGDIATGSQIRKVETDMDINPGNSGGPWVNDQGLVIAVAEGTHMEANDVNIGVDILVVHEYLGIIMPLLPPDSATKLNELGSRHFFENRFDVAFTLFDHALHADPQNAMYLENRGWASYWMENLDAAMADFSRVITLDASQATAYRGRALCHMAAGSADEAMTDLNRAIDLEPNGDLLYQNRGELYYALGDYQSAVNDFTRAIELNSSFATHFRNRADALQELNRHQEALGDLAKAVELNPYDSYSFFLAGYSHFFLGDYESAFSTFHQATELEARPSYWTWKGDTARVYGNLDLAIQCYTTSINLAPVDAMAYYGRGLVYQAAGNSNAARSDFAKAEELMPGVTDTIPRGAENQFSGGSNNGSMIPDRGSNSGSMLPPSGQGSQASLDLSLVGVWYCEIHINGNLVEIAMAFDAQGQFAVELRITYSNGSVETFSDEGTYEFDGRTLRTHGAENGTETYRLNMNGNSFTVRLPDIDGLITFNWIQDLQ